VTFSWTVIELFFGQVNNWFGFKTNIDLVFESLIFLVCARLAFAAVLLDHVAYLVCNNFEYYNLFREMIS
jgi:predicted acyltransferase